tara:strand:- start:61 stop:3342 length:3282 start_codon:yes stop_codon:yes gene_type:complete
MAPFMGVSGFGGPGSALGKYIPDPRLNDTYWIASLETQGGLHAVSTHSTPDRNEGHGIAVDNADGSVYVCGHEVRGYGTYSQTYKNLYLTKFDKAGTLQWQRLVGYNVYTSYPGADGTSGEGRDVVVDSNGDVYVFGEGTIDQRYHSSFSYNNQGILMAKYNSSGEIIWQKHVGGRHGQDEITNGVLIDDSDQIYLPLTTRSIGYSQSSSGGQMMYSVMNTDGVQQFARIHYDTRTGVTQGSVDYDIAGVEKDSSNNIILVGYTDGQANLQGRFGGTVVKFAAGTEGSTTDPKFKYAIYYQDGYGVQDVKVYSVTQDSSGNLYVAGTIIYSQGHAQSIPEEAFICQVPYNVPETIYGDDVTGFWCKRFRYSGSMKLRSTFENGQIRVDSNDNIVAVGSVTKIVSGEKQYLIMKLDSSGNEIWTRTLDTFRTSTGNSGQGNVEDSGVGLAIDNRDNIYVSGTYARSSDKGTMIAKLPGDGSLYDFQKGTPSSLSKIIHGGRYRYSNNDGTGSNTYSYYYDEIGGVSGSYYRMRVNNQSGNVNSNSNHISGYIFHGETTMYTGIGSMGHTVSVLHDVTPASASYDYSFPDEVYYGDGTVGSGTTISLGTQNYHYSGDGTMPAVGLGTVQNWDMFFELKRGKLDVDATSSANFAIGNSGYTQTDGFMLQFKSEYIASAGASAINAMNAYNGGVELKSLMPVSSTNPISTEETRPMSDDWNWFKLEWRGGTSFKIWHKKTPTGNYANLFTSTDSSQITNQTNWDYISIGQTKQHPNFGLQNSNQFYGRIRNFGLNVNSNVVDLSDNRNITDHKLLVHIDASNPNSYSGIGSTCNNLARLVGIVTDTRNVYSGPSYYGVRGSYGYSDVGIWTGSGLDGAGVTTSLSNHTTFNGVPVFTNLRAFSTIKDLAVYDTNTYAGPFQTQDFSYSIWCYPLSTDVGNFRRLINHYEYGNNGAEGWSLVIDYSGYLALRTRYHGTETSSYSLSANNWYNICAVHSTGSTIDFYVNGIKRFTGSTTWPYNYSFDTISIGGVGITSTSNASEAVWTNGGYYYENFSGPIASVAYYNKRLYESEIESNYNRNCSKYGLPYLAAYNTSG